VLRLQFLGIQDAPRKLPPPVQTPGAWVGCISPTSDDCIRQTVAQSKRDRAKSQIKELIHNYYVCASPLLHYKWSEDICGLLCNLSMT
jgi:hypothetical protein